MGRIADMTDEELKRSVERMRPRLAAAMRGDSVLLAARMEDEAQLEEEMGEDLVQPESSETPDKNGKG